MSTLLAAEGVTLAIQEVDYDEWHRGDVISDIWLNSANFTLPLDFSLFSHLYEVPLIQHCINRDWQQDAARWRAGEMDLAAPVSGITGRADDRTVDSPLAADPRASAACAACG